MEKQTGIKRQGGGENRILLAGFEGEGNSAKRLLDALKPFGFAILYLRNDKAASTRQILNVIANFDFILVFGQKPLLKDRLCVEAQAKGTGGEEIETGYPYGGLLDFCRGRYETRVSGNAGTSYCNHLYFQALSYIHRNRLSVNLLFLHIPATNNLKDLDLLVHLIKDYVMFLMQT